MPHQYVPIIPSLDLSSMQESSKALEILPGKMLNINNALTKEQKNSLTTVLQAHVVAFAWDYHDIKSIDPNLCMHMIYINNGCTPIRQPQR